MTMEEVLERAKMLGAAEGQVMSAKLIADAIDRYTLAIDRQTEMQGKNIAMGAQMSNMAKDLFGKIGGQIDKQNEGDNWRDGPNEE